MERHPKAPTIQQKYYVSGGINYQGKINIRTSIDWTQYHNRAWTAAIFF